MTPCGGVLGVVLIVGIPAKLGELLNLTFRVDNEGNNTPGSPARLDKVELTLFVTLGTKGGGPEP